MFPRLALLPIGLFLIWGFICQRWYVCHIKQRCGADRNEIPAPPPEDNRPVVFSWSDEDPVTNATFNVYRDSILKAVPAGQLLEISGLYFKDEKSPKGFANMGLARATKLKELFSRYIEPERIVVSSRLVNEPEGVRNSRFESIGFAFKEQPKGDEVEIIEVENQVSIFFPYGKATKAADPKVDEYLGKLSVRLKQTDETVNIIGHTDDSGTPDYNLKLGQARAQHVQNILVGKGISKDRFSLSSKGESEPVASNDTEEGKRQNRRVVLVLNKKVE
jgi:outer membrane protein OmpA-like peptidoglycan-associated protein